MGARNHRFVHLGALAGVLLLAGIAAALWTDEADAPAPASTDSGTPSATALVTPRPVSPNPSPTPRPVAKDLTAAQALFDEGRFGPARDAFNALAVASNDPAVRAEGFAGAGNAALQLNDTSAGLAALRAAVAEAPSASAIKVRSAYLLLKALNDLDRGEEGIPVFEADRSLASGSPLEPYFVFEAARAYSEKGAFNVARSLLDNVLSMSGATAPLKERVFLEQRGLGRASNRRDDVQAALDGLIALNGDPAARFERAQFSKVAGDTEDYARRMRGLIALSPSSDWALQGLNELKADGYVVDPGDAGLVYYRHSDYANAISTLAPAVDSAPSQNALAMRAYYLGASYEDSGQGAAAIRAYDIAAGTTSNNGFVHKARYWAARVSEWAIGPEAASERYVQLVTVGPAGEFTSESAFRAGYVLLSEGRGAAALEVWSSGGVASSARLEYWRGRALRDAGDAAAATAAFKRAEDLGPLDLYGLEAARELGAAATFDVSFRERDLDKPIDWAAISSWLSSRIGGSPPGSSPTAACELARSGVREAAVAEIRAADASASTWRSFELMREASQCGLADIAAQLAVAIRTEAGVASHDPPKDLLRVSYPLNYAATLEGESLKAGIDPLFFASLVRQESFWDPSARSAADAFGLTQVIEPTGRALASELGFAEFDLSMLFQPALSLEFGAHYLGSQVRQYGNALYALSGYNAGPVNAARWAASGKSLPADVVEVIDFGETKAYVTYIFEAYAHYQLAWGD